MAARKKKASAARKTPRRRTTRKAAGKTADGPAPDDLRQRLEALERWRDEHAGLPHPVEERGALVREALDRLERVVDRVARPAAPAPVDRAMLWSVTAIVVCVVAGLVVLGATGRIGADAVAIVLVGVGLWVALRAGTLLRIFRGPSDAA